MDDTGGHLKTVLRGSDGERTFVKLAVGEACSNL